MPTKTSLMILFDSSF